MKLHDYTRLGSYPDREEFQVGRVIVWVTIPPDGNRAAWVEQANPLFENVWQAIPAVVAHAQQVSRTRLPEFWKQYDDAGTADEPLTVSGIWLNPASGSADYK
jgi:hypothetical protein